MNSVPAFLMLGALWVFGRLLKATPADAPALVQCDKALGYLFGKIGKAFVVSFLTIYVVIHYLGGALYHLARVLLPWAFLFLCFKSYRHGQHGH